MSRHHQSRFIAFCHWLVRYEWLLLALLLPFVLFPSPLRVTALLLLPVLWGARKAVTGHFVPTTPANLSLLVLLLMVLVSFYATFDIAFSIGKIAGLVYGVAVFFAVVAYASQSAAHLWRGVGFFLLSGWGIVAVSLLGAQRPQKAPFVQNIIGLLPERVLSLPGAMAGFNANQVAGVLLWLTPAAWALALVGLREVKMGWAGKRPYPRLLITFAATLTALVFSAALILTQSRAGLFGFAVGMMAMAAIAVWQKSRRLVLAAAAVIFFGVVILFTSAGAEPITNLLFEQAGLEDGSALGTVNGRLEIWSRAIYGIQDFPFTGMGMNNFRRVVHTLYPLFLIPPDRDIAHAHNHLLQAALDLGIPGLIAYLALWLALAIMLLQTWRLTQSTKLRMLTVGFTGSLLAYFVYGMIDTISLGAKPGFVFWLLLGLIAGLHQLENGCISNELRKVRVSGIGIPETLSQVSGIPIPDTSTEMKHTP